MRASVLHRWIGGLISFLLCLTGWNVAASAPAADAGETDKQALSLSIATASPAAIGARSTEEVTLAGCAVTALPSDLSTSTSERAPNLRNRFGRSVYLILASELSAAGIAPGTVISGIGWSFQVAPGLSGSGPLIVYMQNTSDTTNAKSTTWATAISSMQVVHNATTTIPNVTGPFDITFSGGTSFTYTGNALYIAFDAQYPVGGLSTSTVVWCNGSGLAGGLLGAQSNAAAPVTVAASNFRPETRLTPATATILNDAGVDHVVSYGAVPRDLVAAQLVQAVVTNHGANTLTNLPVTLTVTGADSFTDTQIVPSLAPCGGQATVTFAGFTAVTLGSDTLSVTVPADDVAANNSNSVPMDVTSTRYSFKYPGTTAFGGVGLTGATGAFVGKFTTTLATSVTAATLEFYVAGATTYRVAIYADSGSGTPGAQLYLDGADRTVAAAGPVTVSIGPVPVGPGNFFVGIQQTNTTNANLSFDNEVPVRSGRFYFSTPLPVTTWADFAPANNFKLNLGVILDPCAGGPALCNDSNPCTSDTCDPVLGCVHTPSSDPCDDGNACTDGDVCNGGVCVAGPPLDCNDNNPCTDDACGPVGCVHANNSGPCDDGNHCAQLGTCANGLCSGGPPRSCDDGDGCTNDACDPAIGCIHSSNNTCPGYLLVNTTAPDSDGVCDFLNCTLIDAILTAEHSGLPATIMLQNCETYEPRSAYGSWTAYPPITTEIRIVGNGATIERLASAPLFRFFDVSPSGNLTLSNVTLRGGRAKTNGGAISNAGQLTILDSVLENNVAGPGPAYFSGGAISQAVCGDILIKRSTLRNNAARLGGAVATLGVNLACTSSVSIASSAIVGNQALNSNTLYPKSGLGGGIYCSGDTALHVDDSTVAGNRSASDGGGIFVDLASATRVFKQDFIQSTVTANVSVSGHGGGVANNGVGGDWSVENSIIANNLASSAVGTDDWYGSYLAYAYNLIGVGTGSFPHPPTTQFVTTLAGLSPLMTTTGNAGGEHHALESGCAAIDRIPPGALQLDQLGMNRVATFDIGAIEYRECARLPNNAADWWPFDETAGSVSRDLVSVFNNGSQTGSPPPSPGMVGGSLCFDGGSQFVTVPDHFELDFGGSCTPFTIDAWVKTCASGRQTILDKRDQQGTNFLRGYSLFIENGRLGFQMATGSGNLNCNSTGSACSEYLSAVPDGTIPDLADNRWHFVAVSVPRCNGALILHIDGMDAHPDSSLVPRSGDLTNAKDLLIAQSYPISSETFPLAGCIDELEIFKRALSIAELQSIYQAGWAGKCKDPCAQGPWPECGGTCSPGGVCGLDPLGSHSCVCLPYVRPCGDSTPQCNGTCPGNSQCMPAPPGCGCVSFSGNCEGTAPACNGPCNDANDRCVHVSGGGCQCQRIVPCYSTPYPACGAGACPPGQQCLSQGFCSSNHARHCISDAQCIFAGHCILDRCSCFDCHTTLTGGDITLFAEERDALAWEAQECATQYDVYRATGQLPDANHDGLADSYGTCFQSALAETEAFDASLPLRGAPFSYLITGRNALGEGSLGQASNLQERPNVAPCP